MRILILVLWWHVNTWLYNMINHIPNEDFEFSFMVACEQGCTTMIDHTLNEDF